MTASPPHTRSHRRIGQPTAALLAVVLAMVAAVPITGGALADEASVDLAIYNGTEASIADLPFVVYVETAFGSCTGSVLAPEWILTAAHCLRSSDPNGVVIRIGSDSFAAGFPEVTPASQVIIHPDYNPTTNVADLALVRLSSPTTAAPIALVAAATADPVGSRATITGWGDLITLPEPQDTEVLMRADIPVLDDSACSFEWGDSYDPATMVCAGGEGRDVCGGDSGGPLILGSGGSAQQLGLVSFGWPCGSQSSTVGVYTAVAPYRSWIDSHVDSVGFTDIAGTTHEANIALVAANAIAGGYHDGTYRPDHYVTRGQMATFLMRAGGLVDPGGQPFRDVPASHAHAAGIRAVSHVGIAGGFQDGSYRPEALVTRAQMGTFLFRALGLTDPGTPFFVDVPAPHTHAAGIQAVAFARIAGGFADGTYGPEQGVTRGQMATFMARGYLGSALAPTPAPLPELSQDPDALYTACGNWDMAACDALFAASLPGSTEQIYAESCGDRIPPGTGMSCVDAFANPLSRACAQGDMNACDRLFGSSQPDSWDAYLADTCAFRQDPGTGRWCAHAFGVG